MEDCCSVLLCAVLATMMLVLPNLLFLQSSFYVVCCWCQAREM